MKKKVAKPKSKKVRWALILEDVWSSKLDSTVRKLSDPLTESEIERQLSLPGGFAIISLKRLKDI